MLDPREFLSESSMKIPEHDNILSSLLLNSSKLHSWISQHKKWSFPLWMSVVNVIN